MDRLAIFNQHRAVLFAIAYRMLSTVTDAEDILQEAWIRWQSTETAVQSPKAFLSSLVTRLCIDQLRSARTKRERYFGVWLPEPLVTNEANQGDDKAELAESLSFAFLMLLECLSPTERAVFLLREVFDYDYSEVSKAVGKSIPNCRQILRRARQHLILRRSEVSVSPQHKEEIVLQFLTSWHQGDVHGLVNLMAEDVVFWADGGGQATAAQKPLQGCQKVARFLVAIRRSPIIPSFSSKVVRINHQPGILNIAGTRAQSALNFEFVGENIQAIFAVVNPAKLKAVQLECLSEQPV